VILKTTLHVIEKKESRCMFLKSSEIRVGFKKMK